MAMESGSMSPADMRAVLDANGSNNGWGYPVYAMNPCCGYGGGYGGFGGELIWVILLAALFGGFGGGFGGFGGGGGALGLGAVYGAQQFSQLDNGIRAVQNGICDSTFALNNSIKDGFYSVNSNISSALCNTTYELASKIDANRFAAQQCCCETQRAIDGVNFNNSKNTCDIINAIHCEGNATRDLITQNKIEMLQSKLSDKDRDILSRDFKLSQLSQNSYLINRLAPCPIPAYMVANPNCCYNPCSGCGSQFV